MTLQVGQFTGLSDYVRSVVDLTVHTCSIVAEIGGSDSNSEIEADDGPGENQGNHSNGGEEE